MEERSKFIGAWELTDYYIQVENNTKWYPFENDVKGQLIYANRHMSVLIKRDNLNKQNLPNKFTDKLSETDKLFWNVHYIAYCGTFDVNVTQKSVVHNAEIIALEGLQTIQLIRYYSFIEDKLTLTTSPIEKANTFQNNIHVLVWKKIS